MKLTIRRVYDFGSDAEAIGKTLMTPEAWDAARDTSGAFGLVDSRDEWWTEGETAANAERAGEVLAVARELDARSICSYGVGTGLLEQQLHRQAPDLRLTCTDFAPRAVERLARLFPEATVIRHDLLEDTPPEADLHLMHRLETELPDDQWRVVFSHFHAPILFVASEILTVRRAAHEVLRRMRRRNATFAGWFRTEDALRALWSDRFTDVPASVGGLHAYLLRPR